MRLFAKLRDEIAALLNSRAEQLRKELERLTGGSSVTASSVTGNGARATREKPSPKYRASDGSTWCGRGARPRWLTKAIQTGQKLEDFLIVPSDEAASEERISGHPWVKRNSTPPNVEDESTIDCVVRDLSNAGASLEIENAIGIPDRFTLLMKADRTRRTCHVTRRSVRRIGVRFD